MLSPTHVKGAEANPVFKELAAQQKAPAWNFNKYFVKADGKVQAYFAQRRHARVGAVHHRGRDPAEELRPGAASPPRIRSRAP